MIRVVAVIWIILKPQVSLSFDEYCWIYGGAQIQGNYQYPAVDTSEIRAPISR
jgi:hypothetical protein